MQQMEWISHGAKSFDSEKGAYMEPRGCVRRNLLPSPDETVSSVRVHKLKPKYEVSYIFLISLNRHNFKTYCGWPLFSVKFEMPPCSLMTSWVDFYVRCPCGTGIPNPISSHCPFPIRVRLAQHWHDMSITLHSIQLWQFHSNRLFATPDIPSWYVNTNPWLASYWKQLFLLFN